MYVEGRLQTRSWDDQKTGEKKYTTEIVCSDMQMLGSPREQMGGESTMQPYDQSTLPSQSSAPSVMPPATPTVPTMIDTDKDDLPF